MTGPVAGILLMLSATLAFAVGDVATKHLVLAHDILLIAALRYGVNLALLAGWLLPTRGLEVLTVRRPRLVLLRALCLAAATVTMGLALRVMPVGETVAIIYLAPFLVLALSGRVLGEPATRAGWGAVATGFLGVLLILRPGAGLDPVGVGFALMNAGCATAYILLSRKLAQTETTESLLIHTALVGTVIFAALTLARGTGPLPQGMDIWITLLLGVLATLGHALFTRAFRFAPVALLAPVNYCHLVWAALLGLAVFSDLPTGLTILGMALVVLGGIVGAVAGRRG
jgi:drug/metabolite transporter (DMT)-like permease